MASHGSDVTLRAGNSRWLDCKTDPTVVNFISRGYTVTCLTIGGQLVGVFGLEDSIRPEAVRVVQWLRDRRVEVHMVSGDEDGAVKRVAAELGITNVRSHCTPAEKRDYVAGLTKITPGKWWKRTPQPAVTIFCGDGTNDAVALAAATIGGLMIRIRADSAWIMWDIPYERRIVQRRVTFIMIA